MLPEAKSFCRASSPLGWQVSAETMGAERLYLGRQTQLTQRLCISGRTPSRVLVASARVT